VLVPVALGQVGSVGKRSPALSAAASGRPTGAASALGPDASILSPLSQAFGADDKQACRLRLVAHLLFRSKQYSPIQGARSADAA
jgi:hypothetical protein